MKSKRVLAVVGVLAVMVAVLFLIFLVRPGEAAYGQNEDEGGTTAVSLGPVGRGFTYQGHLSDGGNAADGAYEFQFQLFDDPITGTQIANTVVVDPVAVADGLFSVELDFGQSAFGGGGRWLEIGVRPDGSPTPYTILTPRQKLTPAPYALALPNVYTDEANNFVGIGRDFRISGNEVFGVRYEGGANDYGGMYVETSDAQGWPFYGYATNGSFRAWTFYNGTSGDWFLYNAGIRLHVPDEGGLRITPNTAPSNSQSLVISGTATTRSTDGIRIYDTADDGIQIGSSPDYPSYGVYIPSPGTSQYGLWPNTEVASGQWALYTVDNIEAGNVLANAYSLVAKVSGSDSLVPGDVVAVTGVTDPIPGSTDNLPLVGLANESELTGLIGVVSSRMVWEVAPGKEAEGEMSMHSADGAAQPGDYVSLVVLGVTQVKVDPQANIQVGDRLTAAAVPGLARALQTRTVEGMTVMEGAPVIGIALAAPTKGQDTIPVFVTLR